MIGATPITERLEFGSRVFWPALLLNMVFSLPLEVSRAAGWPVIAVCAVNVVIAVFAVLPWAISRAMRKQFPNRILTDGERLRLAALAACGTLGTAVLPLQWGLLVPETNYLVHLLIRTAIWLGIATWAGWLLLWSLHRGSWSAQTRQRAISRHET